MVDYLCFCSQFRAKYSVTEVLETLFGVHVQVSRKSKVRDSTVTNRHWTGTLGMPLDQVLLIVEISIVIPEPEPIPIYWYWYLYWYCIGIVLVLAMAVAVAVAMAIAIAMAMATAPEVKSFFSDRFSDFFRKVVRIFILV